ncbi:MAG: hypothetical protein OEV44_05065 [Spirochaetota bacterium]|nr:hypothetical protein [Spirochaetota bacterium]
MKQPQTPSTEQLKYASLLQILSIAGISLLIIGFIIYVGEILTPIIPVDELNKYWNLNSTEYISKTGIPTGWNWIFFLNKGDIISFLGIIILTSADIICFIRVLPIFIKKKDNIYIFIIILQIIVFIFAASGIFEINH